MASNGYRLLVVDIDGTLLGRDGKIAAEDREALLRTAAAGKRVAICTGRAVPAARVVFEQLPLDGHHIFYDGALVSGPAGEGEVCAYPVSGDLVKEMVEFAHANQTGLEFYSATRLFAERESWATEVRRRFFGVEAAIIDFADLWRRERVIKGTLSVRTPEEKERAARFHRRFRRQLSFSWTKTPAYPGVDFINILANGVSKKKAVEALARHLGIPLAEVMAIGDGSNDVSLLSAVGLAVAMENAEPEVKAVADHITLDVDHHGVAAAVDRFLLGALDG